jgi:murein DD-endopeptidase MepM/ murein hydrolase activator NlpD
MRIQPRSSSALAAIALASGLLAGCAGGDTPVLDQLPPLLAPSADGPSLSAKRVVERPEPRPAPRWAPASPTWVFPLPADHGVRADAGGQGQFLAPRSHGKHNGIDMLAPVGTPVLAACDGQAKSDRRGGYGRVVQLVCPVPGSIAGGDEDLHVSLFYAHLDRADVGKRWTKVKAGQPLGKVGKTGNASGPRIKPHLHLEMIVRASEEEALAERHSGQNAKAARAADAFFAALEDECLEPAHLTARADVRRERRVDPFVMLVCSSRPKPAFTLPDEKPLREAAVKWSRFYESPAFDVDEGPRPRDADAKAEGG